MSDDGDGRADGSVPDDAAERSDDPPAARGVGTTDGSDGSNDANGSVAADGEDVNDGGDANDGGDPPVLGDLQGDAENLEERVDALHEQARDARAAFEPPADPEERALTYCREGLWPVLAVYVDRRGARAALGQPHHDRLEDALNTWLELYARCYGVDIDPAFSVREAAELFVSTHNVLDVAQLLTDVPDRWAGDGT